MELSAAVSDGIQVAGSSSLDEKTFQEVVKHSVRCTLEPDGSVSAQEGVYIQIIMLGIRNTGLFFFRNDFTCIQRSFVWFEHSLT